MNATMEHHLANRAFLTALDAQTKKAILSAIALHYEVSMEDAFQEVTEEGAECLLDYLTGSVRTATSLLMKRHNRGVI